MTQENITFSERLKLALQDKHHHIKNGTDLARFFNLQHLHGISVQTAHKWLSGRVMPSTDKTAILAAWLHVPLHWLHYGLTSAEPN